MVLLYGSFCVCETLCLAQREGMVSWYLITGCCEEYLDLKWIKNWEAGKYCKTRSFVTCTFQQYC